VFDAGEIQHVSAQAATLRGLVGRVDHIEATLTDAGRLDAATVLTRLDDAVSQERAAGLDAGTDAVLAVAARDTVGHASSPVAVQAAVTGLADRATAIVQRAQAKLAVDQAAAALAARRNDASAALTRGDRLLLQAAPLTGLQYATDSATIAAQHQAFTAAVTLAQYDAVTGTATDAADHIAALLAARSGAYTDMASARTNLQRASTEKVDAGTAPAQLDALQAQLDQAGTGAAFNAVDRAITQVMAPILDRIGIAELGIGKVIVMSLDRQSLTAYQDGVALVTTPITTGRPALPTPPGSYSVLRKNHPWLMTSDWPRSSPYWYPPSEVQYTLWFRNDGYAIHDAPWRSRYGPGTQANGSHGCVNVPMPTMTTLFSWADVGTRVIVK
jgi:lipoprotein-anchoring transpeptidase ErfK/SrfK